MTVDQAMQIATQHRQAGRWMEAAALCQQVLAQQSNHLDALRMLGSLASQAGNYEAAANLFRRLTTIKPDAVEAWGQLGNSLMGLRKFDGAADAYERVIGIRPDLAEAYSNLGVALSEMGKFEQAMTMCRRAVQLKPLSAEAHLHLGNALSGEKQFEQAIGEYRRSIQLKPEYAKAHFSLAKALKLEGKLDEAAPAYQQAIQLNPHDANAWNDLGSILRELGKLSEASAAYLRATQLQPDFADGHNNFGVTLMELGKLPEATQAFERAIQLRPAYAEAHNNLGNAVRDQGQSEQALAMYRRAVELKPEYAEAWDNLGNALRDAGLVREAIAAARQAVQINPGFAAGHLSLANHLRAGGQLDESVLEYEKSIELKPDLAEAHNNLGNALKDQGRLDEALAAFSRAIAINPRSPRMHSNLAYTVCFHPDYDAQAILQTAREWDQAHGHPSERKLPAHLNDRTQDGQLKVGYVSPDFRNHVVGRNVLPILERHDRERFEIHCFSAVTRPDALTKNFQSAADRWHDIARVEDMKVAELIRQKQIDILVDLALHMAGNRLPVFGYKPAPVQVTWAGYPGTTGMAAMDYRLTDPYLDPPGEGDELYAEQSVRLPHSFWCYRPPVAAPEVNALPAKGAGFITFGCLNNFTKITGPAIDLWAKILEGAPRSRLLMLAHAGEYLQAVIREFGSRGINPGRLEFAAPRPAGEYFRLYHRIDISLDPMPYTGHTTSLDALWMGVPVVTLAGQTVVSRGGASALHNLNLRELIARQPDAYVKIAIELASDLDRLSQLRRQLRQRMLESPLTDEIGFTRDLESAYRWMWRKRCES